MLIDRYASNEPVLNARLEVESGPLKAVAAFRAEPGDDVVTDAALLKALAAPGEHGLVFTLVAGQDSDLLDGTLVRPARPAAAGAAQDGHGHTRGGDGHDHDHHHDHDHGCPRAAWLGAAAAALGLGGVLAWWRLRRRQAGQLHKGL